MSAPSRRLIINEETVPENTIVEWKEEEIKVVVERPDPAEKIVQVASDFQQLVTATLKWNRTQGKLD